MTRETAYIRSVSAQHIKTYGQYFTAPSIAAFMCRWACMEAESMLDPAAGNSVFLLQARKLCPKCIRTGYEIDGTILDFFGNPSNSKLLNEDFLRSGWDARYDAIVGNPPYGRFQNIPDREQILDAIFSHTGVQYSRYTNLYILFLIKSLAQLTARGRLSFIIPTEFLNSEYGTAIKEKLLSERLLKGVIRFSNDREIFPGAVTTCCILLIDHSPKDHILFYDLETKEMLQQLRLGQTDPHVRAVPYAKIRAEEKWRKYMEGKDEQPFANLTEISRYCTVTRGIATGANDFFCMSASRMQRLQIPPESCIPCVCRSADVSAGIFTQEDFDALSRADRTVHLLCADCGPHSSSLAEYIRYGKSMGYHERYLPGHRKPWYAMERRSIAPIWVSSATRSGLKFVRNLAGVNCLTAFHSIYIRDEYEDLTDVIFCYFLTPIAQEIIRENRKEMGNALEKFQPCDIAHAQMLDLSVLTEKETGQIRSLYHALCEKRNGTDLSDLTKILSAVFTPHLKG